MIHVNPDAVEIPPEWAARAKELTSQLIKLPASSRASFIDRHRQETWAHVALLDALRSVIGNKCWYSEVPLEGADPNVDHFRPKGQVREVDRDLQNTKMLVTGYWWLAFESRNFRLSAEHANQRRVDVDSSGGKWDYFPVRGRRAPEGTDWGSIVEDTLALDPCSASDVRLLWFDPDGAPGCATWRGHVPSAADHDRVRATIWLYHLNKSEIQIKRAKHISDIRKDVAKANGDYELWNRDSVCPNLQAKASFDRKVAEIRRKIHDFAEFAGAKRCAVALAAVDHPWIEEFVIL